MLHDVAEFLGRQPPFDELDSEALDRLAASAEIEFFPAGALVFGQGEAPASHVRVVRTGAIELIDEGRVLDLLGEGELFGHPSMLSGLPTGFATRAHEDTLCYRLPAETFLPLLSGPAGLRFLGRSLRERARLSGAASVALAPDPADRPVATLLRPPPVIVDAGTSIRAVAQRMTEAGISSVVVQEGGRTAGIVTDRDLRMKVVAEEISSDAPIAEIMTRDVLTVPFDRPVSQVLLDMLAEGVRHMPVLAADGSVLGIVEPTDLLAAETRAPFRLRRAIDTAPDGESLATIARELGPALVALHDARVAPVRVAAMMSLLVDALTRRLIELAVERHGEPPARVAWLALGSLGRGECVPSSDLDSALVWEGDDRDPAMVAWTEALAHDVIGALRSFGLRGDEHGVVATDARLARSVDAWHTALEGWIADPFSHQGLIYVSLLCDARLVWGDAPVEPLLQRVRDARRDPRLPRLLGQLALRERPPTGFLRDVVVEHSGDRRGKLDVKRCGTNPVTSLARYAGLAAGSPALTTHGRLTAARGTVLGPEDARTLAEAFDLLLGLRLEHQIEQLRHDRPPDDLLNPETLNPLTRRYLREAFRAVARVQRAIQRDVG